MELAAASATSQLFQVFIAGIGTSLTPCVYPLIPITLSIFGAAGETSRLKSFGLSATYVLGIALTYTILGLFSALSGSVFGSLLGNPWVVTILGALLLTLTCSTLDLFGPSFLGGLQNKASSIGGKGFRGAFLMGTVSALVAAPCVGPVLILILGIAATSGQALWGAILLFVYALGFGVLFMLLGAFPGLLKRLPRSGNWLLVVKFIIALALLLAFLFVTQRYTFALLPEALRSGTLAFCTLSIIGLAILLTIRMTGMRRLQIVAATCFALAIFPWLSLSNSSSSRDEHWLSGVDATLAEAKARGTIAMVDFYADWCAACKELDAITFPDPSVRQELANLALGRVDFTEPDDTLSERYSIVGLPCILFLRADGSEIEGSRITGFLTPSDFIAHLKTKLPATQ
ncbi:MAG: thioredoxin family protein [Oligoflexia bacterium]|nr:thioredoxin family protein [Oligoflexia bacterium]